MPSANSDPRIRRLVIQRRIGLVLFVPGFALAVSAGLVIGMLIVGDLASDRGWIAAALAAGGLALLLPAGLLYGSARQNLRIRKRSLTR